MILSDVTKVGERLDYKALLSTFFHIFWSNLLTIVLSLIISLIWDFRLVLSCVVALVLEAVIPGTLPVCFVSPCQYKLSTGHFQQESR